MKNDQNVTCAVGDTALPYSTSPYCNKCGKLYVYVGDVPEGGYPKGMEPWCTCELSAAPANIWQYCPHCGKELK